MPNAAMPRRSSPWASALIVALSVCLPILAVAAPATAVGECLTVDGLRSAFDAALYLPVTTASRTY